MPVDPAKVGTRFGFVRKQMDSGLRRNTVVRASRKPRIHRELDARSPSFRRRPGPILIFVRQRQNELSFAEPATPG
ncbi:MAG: hypothetical protein ABW186_11025, partial [Rhodanobacteraceae bacterium]